MHNKLNLRLTLYVCAALTLTSCGDDADDAMADIQPQPSDDGQQIAATIADGLHQGQRSGDELTLLRSGSLLYAVYPAESQATSDGGSLSVTIPATQEPGEGGHAPAAAPAVGRTTPEAEAATLYSLGGGICFTLQMEGVSMVELESVDGYPLAGTVAVGWDGDGRPTVASVADAQSIVTLRAEGPGGLAPGAAYCIATLPCDVYGGYRLSIYRNGMVAHYFGVHQTVERASYIAPTDLVESELEFADVDAPLVEEERPELDATTRELLRQYQKDPTEDNRQALLEQMGIRYDKVVARKKAKLRELEREAKTQGVIDEMQAIVDEMVENREVRLQQQFLRLIDPRDDDDPTDAWMVLRGASAPDAYIGYAPVTNAEYALFAPGHAYDSGKEDYPAVNITIAEATAYCDWLSGQDRSHLYRLPTDEEWILGAGHMPKDVAMNAGHVERGLTAVDAYARTTGACGGIDFWGNCWEWTTTVDADGKYVVKGGSWDSDRDDCRSEKSDVVRDGTRGYANVGFRVVRTAPTGQ